MKTTTVTNPSVISQTDLVRTKAGKYRIPKAVSKQQLYDAVLMLLEDDICSLDKICSADKAKQYLHIKLAKIDYETFHVLYLDSQHNVIGLEQLFSGTIDQSPVYPREVLKRCLYKGAKAVILVHNHPSGVPEPSRADIDITKRITEALEHIDVNCLDHCIIGGHQIVSFAERGLL